MKQANQIMNDNTRLRLEHRMEQPYVALHRCVLRKDIPEVLPPLIPEVVSWLAKNNEQPAGSPFFLYLEMDGEVLNVAVGVPTKSQLKGDERVKAGSFPAAKYAVASYFGHYSNLYQVHAALEKYGEENGIKAIGHVAEFYITDPQTEPDPDKWQTDIVARVEE